MLQKSKDSLTACFENVNINSMDPDPIWFIVFASMMKSEKADCIFRTKILVGLG